MGFLLSDLVVCDGAQRPPLRVVIFGAAGVGKTTLGTSFPASVVLRTEDGIGRTQATVFPLCKSYPVAVEYVKALYEQPHNFQTLVVDSADWLTPLVEAEAQRRHGVSDLAAVEYGRGYTWAADVWKEFMACLDKLRLGRSMHIVILAHAAPVEMRDPQGEKYTAWGLKLQKQVASRLQEWSDEIWYLTTDIVAGKTSGKERIGRGSGSRVVHTMPSAGWTAKTRWLNSGEYVCGEDMTYSAILAELFSVQPVAAKEGDET